jgi:hypothetical protein
MFEAMDEWFNGYETIISYVRKFEEKKLVTWPLQREMTKCNRYNWKASILYSISPKINSTNFRAWCTIKQKSGSNYS